MWEKLIEFGKQLLALKKQVEKNMQELRQDLKKIFSYIRKLENAIVKDNHEKEKLILKLQSELKNTSLKNSNEIEKIILKLENGLGTEKNEREKLILRLENILLKVQRQFERQGDRPFLLEESDDEEESDREK